LNLHENLKNNKMAKNKEDYAGGLQKIEVDYIEAYMKKNNPTVFEWGMGTSTLRFPKYCKSYDSLEHNEDWYLKTKEKNKQTNCRLHLVKNNKPRTKPTKAEEFRDYINFIESFENEHFDVFFADGRARIFCIEKGLDKLKNDGIVFLHDYTPQRTNYHWIENFMNKIDQVGALGIFKKR